MSVPFPPNAYQTNPYQPQPKVRFEWIGEAWQLFLANAGTWIVTFLITGVISYLISLAASLVFGFSASAFARSSSAFSSPGAMFLLPGYWISVLISLFVNAFLLSGLLNIANAQVRGQQTAIGMLFSGSKFFLPLFLFQLLFSIASTVGFFLLVLPLFIVVGLLAPAMPLIADGVPLGQAIERSVNAMKADWLMAGVFALVLMLIIIASAIPCGLGLFVSYPMAILILSLIYRDMIGMPLPNTPDPLQSGYGAAQPGVWPPSPGAASPTPYSPQPAQPIEPTSPPWSTGQPLAGAPQPQQVEPELGRENEGGSLPPASAP